MVEIGSDEILDQAYLWMCERGKGWCYHLLGHGGAKAAVQDVVDNLPGKPFVFRTDVKSYYASIDHDF